MERRILIMLTEVEWEAGKGEGLKGQHVWEEG